MGIPQCIILEIPDTLNDSIYNFAWVFPHIPEINCIVGIMLTCPISKYWQATRIRNYVVQQVVYNCMFAIYISSGVLHSCFYFMDYSYYEYCRSNFLITASCDGHIKFWKKTNEEGLVFVKHFRTHLGEFLSPYRNKISSEFQFYLHCILVVIRCLQTL